MRPILVVSDLTHASDEAVRMGARLCAAAGAELHVAYCAGLVGMSLREALPLLESAPAALLARRLKEQILRACPPGLPVRAIPHVQYGSIAEGARHTAAAVDAALVVVGADADGMAALPSIMAAAGVPVLLLSGAAATPSPAAAVDALEAMVEESDGVLREPEAPDVELEPALA